MNELLLLKDFQQVDERRKTFNNLAFKVFGISFEEWYQKGYWNDRYEPYTLFDGERAVANVSVNKLSLVVEGQRKNAIQIGTVMTDPEYRGKGLSARLMNEVMKDYENKVDIVYLFANHSVLDFYPKFGFKCVEESQYIITLDRYDIEEKKNLSKLNMNNDSDRSFVHSLVLGRVHVTQKLATENSEAINMFYVLNVFQDHIYYINECDAVVIFQKDGESLHVYDIITKSNVDLMHVLNCIRNVETKKVVFHFTVDEQFIRGENQVFKGTEVLFYKAKDCYDFPTGYKHPVTSQA